MFLETKPRTMVKTLTWRICAILNSYLALVWFHSQGDLFKALIMNATGFCVFYFFERVWNKIQWGKISYNSSKDI